MKTRSSFLITGIPLLIFVSIATAIAVLAQSNPNETDSLLKIRSGIVKTWKQPFHFEEDDLHRIYKVLEKASRELSDKTQVVLKIIREDDRFYETTRIEDVLSDPNSTKRFIEYIRIELRIVEPHKVRDPWESPYHGYVEFQRRGKIKAKMKVSHLDRSWSLLLADELEAQVERTFHNKRTPTWLIIAFAISLYAWGYRLKPFAEKSDLAQFLHRAAYNPLIFGVGLGFLFAVSNQIMQSEMYIRYFGPESGFMWGECANILAERESSQNSVFWIVVVGLPLSVCGGIAVSVLMGKSDGGSKAEK